jgi:hypothetical protein
MNISNIYIFIKNFIIYFKYNTYKFLIIKRYLKIKNANFDNTIPL